MADVARAPRLVGAFSAEKPADDEIRAFFETAEVMAAVGVKMGHSVTSLSVLSFKTQVVSAQSAGRVFCAMRALNHHPPPPPPLPRSQA